MALKDELVAAICGAILVAVGVAMWSLAAGFVLAGIELVGGAYVAAYLKAQTTKVRQ